MNDDSEVDKRREQARRSPGAPSDARRRRLLNSMGLGGLALGVAGRGMGQDASVAPPTSWQEPGSAFSNYGLPPDDSRIIRWISAEPSLPGSGISWTPLHELEGSITPNGLHFERHHGGVPALGVDSWNMVIEGKVNRPRLWNLATLEKLELHSRLSFLECGGNSNTLWRDNPVQAPAGWLHGLVSSGEWSGVPLRRLLQASEPASDARWLIATGLDPAGVTVSLSLDELPEDSMVALYRNGEPLRAEHGWPARLLLPGLEGICNVKWLGRLELADRPAMSRYDTVSYTDMRPDGLATRFSRVMGVKSVITAPAVGDYVSIGPLAISGLAWSGAAAIEHVDISVDGGRQWHEAVLDESARDRAFVRFRLTVERRPGERIILQSRARDTRGRVQPTRDALLAAKGAATYYHYNAILSAEIDAEDGRVVHVYA